MLFQCSAAADPRFLDRYKFNASGGDATIARTFSLVAAPIRLGSRQMTNSRLSAGILSPGRSQELLNCLAYNDKMMPRN
jgi:hypothetical protein